MLDPFSDTWEFGFCLACIGFEMQQGRDTEVYIGL